MRNSMRKIYYIALCLSALFLTPSCINKEKVKEKIRAAKETVAKKKSGKAKGDKPADPSLTPAQAKALDKEDPWFARDFRMELTIRQMNSMTNAEIQKSGDVLYYHFWNSSGDNEFLLFLGEEEIKVYQISTKTKMAQLTRTVTDDYPTTFYNMIGKGTGVVYNPGGEGQKKKSESDEVFIKSETSASVDVTNERWNGFDCEKITKNIVVKSDAGGGMKALGAILGKKELGNTVKQMGLEEVKTTDIVWLDKRCGAVLHREYKMDSGKNGLGAVSQQMVPMPSVSLFTFSPDASLIPTSLEGYKLVK